MTLGLWAQTFRAGVKVHDVTMSALLSSASAGSIQLTGASGTMGSIVQDYMQNVLSPVNHIDEGYRTLWLARTSVSGLESSPSTPFLLAPTVGEREGTPEPEGPDASVIVGERGMEDMVCMSLNNTQPWLAMSHLHMGTRQLGFPVLTGNCRKHKQSKKLLGSDCLWLRRHLRKQVLLLQIVKWDMN